MTFVFLRNCNFSRQKNINKSLGKSFRSCKMRASCAEFFSSHVSLKALFFIFWDPKIWEGMPEYKNETILKLHKIHFYRTSFALPFFIANTRKMLIPCGTFFSKIFMSWNWVNKLIFQVIFLAANEYIFIIVFCVGYNLTSVESKWTSYCLHCTYWIHFDFNLDTIVPFFIKIFSTFWIHFSTIH